MVKATFLGHACWMLESGEHRLLIDPFLTGNPKAAASADEVDPTFILVSHGHSDHLGDTVAIAKRTGATVISVFEIASYAQQKGVQAHGMHLGGAHEFPFGSMKLIPALHGSSIEEDGQIIYLGNPCGFLIELGGRRIYHSGDTALFSDMKLVARKDPVDLAMLPIGDNYTMGVDDAVEAVRLVAPTLVAPMHYDTFPLLHVDAEGFKRRVEEETNSRCVLVAPGESIEI